MRIPKVHHSSRVKGPFAMDEGLEEPRPWGLWVERCRRGKRVDELEVYPVQAGQRCISGFAVPCEFC